MKIAIRGGHNPKASGCKALIDEVTEDRKVKDAVIKYLKQLGANVIDVTPGNLDATQDLQQPVKKANTEKADLFVSIHFNKAYSKYNGSLGSEVCVYNKNDYGQRIVNSLGNLGFKNRGQKIRQELYETRSTKMTAIVVEVCFVEATKDVELYKKLGPDKIGKAIAEAIMNKKVKQKQTRYSVKVSGMTDQKRQQLIIDFLKENGYGYTAETYEVEI